MADPGIDTDALLASMPYAVAAGIGIEAAPADGVRGGLDWAAERCTAGGVLHGAALMALADSLGAVCAFLNLPEGAGTSTIESKNNFFRGLGVGRGAPRGPRPADGGQLAVADPSGQLGLRGGVPTAGAAAQALVVELDDVGVRRQHRADRAAGPRGGGAG